MTTQAIAAAHGAAGDRPRARRLRAKAARYTQEAGAIGQQAVPIVAAGALNVVISLTDTAMMAWLDPQALAGGAVVSDVYSIAFYFATGILAAVTPMAAAAIGAGDPRRVGMIVGNALVLLVVLALAGFWLIGNVVALLGGIGVALPRAGAAADYAAYMAWAFAFMLVFALGRSTLAALGRGRPPLMILAALVPLNALGNYVFMYGAFGAPELGLAGAGAASALVGLVAAVSTVAYLLMAPGLAGYGLRSGLGRFDPALLLRIARMGLMIAVTAVAETGVFLSSTIVVGLVAADALPAHALVFRVLGLCYSVIVGFGQAVTVRVALAWGAADMRRERLARRTAELMALGLAAAYVVAFCIVGPALVTGLAGDAPEARQLAEQARALMPFAGLSLAGLALVGTSTAILRARADVTAPAALTIAGYWLVGETTILVLTRLAGFGGEGVWYGLAAGTLAAAAAVCGYRAWRERPAGAAHV